MLKNKKVIYLAHHALGDLVMKVPAIRFLSEKFGFENVYLTVKSDSLAQFLHDFLSIPRQNIFVLNIKSQSWLSLCKLALRMRNKSFYYYILPPTINIKAGKVLRYLLGASKLIAPPRDYCVKFQHKVYQDLAFCRFWGHSDNEIIEIAQKFYFLGIIETSCIKELPNGPYLLFHPGSGFIEKHKRYTTENYVALVTLLLEKYPSYKIVFTTAGDEEDDIFKKIKNDLSKSNDIVQLHDLDLKQMISALKQAVLIISGDCGPSHLASILRVPQIVIFGPTDPKITSPFSLGKTHIIQSTPLLDCSPCYGSIRYGIMGCGNNRCMQKVKPEQIMSLIEEKKLIGSIKDLI